MDDKPLARLRLHPIDKLGSRQDHERRETQSFTTTLKRRN